jgi:hypothetical protein
VLERSDAERRFLLGRAFESLRAGYAILMRLSATESAQWLRLCRGLLSPVAERDGATQDFVAGLSRPNQQVLERLATAERGSGLSPEEFLAALPLLNDRVGLLCCDDIGAAVRVMARAQGEELAVVEGHGGGILLGQVAGGAELARYYLSDSYNELAATLRDTTRL